MLEEEKEQKEEKQLVTVGQLAYCKIVYHLIRYPTAKVTGTTIATQEHSLAPTLAPSPTPTPSSTPPSSTPPSVSLSTWWSPTCLPGN